MKIRKEIVIGFIALASFFVAYKIGRNIKCKKEKMESIIDNRQLINSTR